MNEIKLKAISAMNYLYMREIVRKNPERYTPEIRERLGFTEEEQASSRSEVV